MFIPWNWCFRSRFSFRPTTFPMTLLLPLSLMYLLGGPRLVRPFNNNNNAQRKRVSWHSGLQLLAASRVLHGCTEFKANAFLTPIRCSNRYIWFQSLFTFHHFLIFPDCEERNGIRDLTFFSLFFVFHFFRFHACRDTISSPPTIRLLTTTDERMNSNGKFVGEQKNNSNDFLTMRALGIDLSQFTFLI